MWKLENMEIIRRDTHTQRERERERDRSGGEERREKTRERKKLFLHKISLVVRF